MVVNDELIACFIEGKCTPEENSVVRRYLCDHPEEFEHVMLLIDNFKRAPGATQKCDIEFKNDSTTDIAMSAAAFAPITPKPEQTRKNSKSSKRNDKISDITLRLLDEIDNL